VRNKPAKASHGRESPRNKPVAKERHVMRHPLVLTTAPFEYTARERERTPCGAYGRLTAPCECTARDRKR